MRGGSQAETVLSDTVLEPVKPPDSCTAALPPLAARNAQQTTPQAAVARRRNQFTEFDAPLSSGWAEIVEKRAISFDRIASAERSL